jgi:lipid-binding SYLF domain-containing protein
MKTKSLAVILAACALFLNVNTARADQTKTEVVERIQSGTKVLHEILNTPDKGIPDEVLKGAKCVAVVPHLLKAGFIFAGKHGRGLATCMLPNGSWSAPAFFAISGGSWGAQIGVESVDLVLMIMNEEGMRHLMEDKFQVGGSIAAAAGPVGRHAEAGTDWKVESQILTYSRAKGLFAGIDLGGSVVERDRDSTVAFYGKEIPTREILDGKVPVRAEARPFVAEVKRAKLMAQNRH